MPRMRPGQVGEPVVSAVGDVIGAVGGLGLAIADVARRLEAEKKTPVTVTHTLDATLS
jgi:hypothetical protein